MRDQGEKVGVVNVLHWFQFNSSQTTQKSKCETNVTLLPINVTDVMDRACACLKSVLRLGVDKDHRTSSWELILYQTCTTIEMN